MANKKTNKTPDLIDNILAVLSLFASSNTEKNIDNKRRNRFMKKHVPEKNTFNKIKTDFGSYDVFSNYLLENKSSIGLVTGKRGSGKSAVAMKILENIAADTGRHCQAMGFNAADLPGWIEAVDSIENITNGSFVIIDEGGVLFSSRSSMGKMNKMLSELLFISRHKNLSILFITQNSSNVEINIIRQLDYIILKKSALLQLDFERAKIKNIYSETYDSFVKYKNHQGLMYIYSDVFRGFVENELPSFWCDNISKNFKDK